MENEASINEDNLQKVNVNIRSDKIFSGCVDFKPKFRNDSTDKIETTSSQKICDTHEILNANQNQIISGPRREIKRISESGRISSMNEVAPEMLAKRHKITKENEINSMEIESNVLPNSKPEMQWNSELDPGDINVLSSIEDQSIMELPITHSSDNDKIKIESLNNKTCNINTTDVLQKDSLESDFLDESIPWKDILNLEQFAEKDSGSVWREPSCQYIVENVKKYLEDNQCVMKLTVKSIHDKKALKSCILRGTWVDSIVNVGDTVNVFNVNKEALKLEDYQVIIDDDSGFIIVNPDNLISCTAISSTVYCMRQAVLTNKFRKWRRENANMVKGQLLHQLFQEAVNRVYVSEKDVADLVVEIIEKTDTMLMLCSHNTTEDVIKEAMLECTSCIADWVYSHCAFSGRMTGEPFLATVKDIEDSVWSTKYGLKGKIDLTLNVVFPNRRENGIMVVPLELKTGKQPNDFSNHKGQLYLYLLMMKDHFENIHEGFLLYLKGKTARNAKPCMEVIHSKRNEFRGLVQLRNKLAYHISYFHKEKNIYLPSPINQRGFCQKCDYLLPCTLFQRAYDNKKELNESMSTLVPSTTAHLSSKDLKFFKEWLEFLLSQEERVEKLKPFWNESPISREENGLCFSHVILKKDVPSLKDDNLFIHSFSRDENSPIKSNFKTVGLVDGDHVVITNQMNRLNVGITQGTILKVEDNEIQVTSERDLLTAERYKDCTFRIDKSSSPYGAILYNNILCLMEDNKQADLLRKLIVDKKKPTFSNNLSKDFVYLYRSILKLMNVEQYTAIFNSLIAKEYAIITGMPGTGKTYTIVSLVRILVKMGKSVLLASFTNAAVDKILLKLLDHGIDFVRTGSHSKKIHKDIKKYTFDNVIKNCSTSKECKAFINKIPVVGTTCMSINQLVFTVRQFDVCILDKASQINTVTCLGPLFCAHKFILVGDEKQSPPMTMHEDPQAKDGHQENLLERLSTPKNTFKLCMQYRMNK